MKNLRTTLLIIAAGLFFFGSGTALGQNGHGGAHGMGGMKTQDVLVEGVLVSFSVMANSEHKKMLRDMKMKEDIEAGTTHNITVTLKDQQSQQPITDANVSMRVIDPAGKDQIKTLTFEPSMNSYDAYFNLPEKGKHQILVLAKYGDQKKTAGIYYQVR
jgi:adenine deaminase